ncbi:uncharacterized protein RMCFA_3608 [Mycolicibacterium fortuitum subsp. acetamidolyticum]|uniref:DUF7352 domain-containing protein n=1 Tax=Mycolicibacterium fortuitum subsp. acetamidolyticum TaxID=144550 RepID=A0A100WSB7_MYCFO|nr:hypothetical protein [Mycolicibacterium fortuitum]MCV7139787.1 hypothetical protein [Mycolicibacterium fortuitum]GAT03496.1 uncharacterized protein RMCFA_3608 [Mycolicibacterium fortuitum subsp. acetamidolyticum]
MKAIYKYKLEPQDEQILPLRGPVLSAGVQGDDIMVWAVHDDEMTPRKVRISTRGTGHALDGADDGQFIGTVLLGSLVFHIFANYAG